jgi:hypothetical protein
MGVVYLARDERLDRRVALKVIAPNLAADPDFRERFITEARSAAAIEHPNAVPVYSSGVVDDDLYMAMRYIEGVDLRTLLAEQGALEPEAAVRIVAEVAAALDAAHRAGMVHRDVKPANILLSGAPGEGTAYLTDFGLTKGAGGSGGPLTGTGQWVGTIDYVAPEQIQSGVVDARTDVYALGCVLYELLTGSVPYTGNDMQKMWGHVNEPFPALESKLPGAAAGLAAVTARATAKNPDERFPSAGDLARAASAALSEEPIETSEHSVATGAAATGLAQTATAQRPPVGIGQGPTVAGRSPASPRERPTRQMGSPRQDGGHKMRTAAILGAAAVIAAGLLAAAVVIAGGDSGSTSTTVTTRQTGAKQTRPSEGRGSTDPLLPANRSECASGVFVEARVPGRPYTSCPFAREVARAFRAGGQNDTITAFSPVTGKSYNMSCEGLETVRCSDGHTAIVYLTYPAIASTSSAAPAPVEEEPVSSSSSTSATGPGAVATRRCWAPSQANGGRVTFRTKRSKRGSKPVSSTAATSARCGRATGSPSPATSPTRPKRRSGRTRRGPSATRIPTPDWSRRRRGARWRAGKTHSRAASGSATSASSAGSARAVWVPSTSLVTSAWSDLWRSS